MSHRLTRFKITLVGCLLALASSFAAPNSNSETPQECRFAAPEEFGSWELHRQETLSERELEILGADDHWRWIYRNRQSEQTVTATLIAGAGGPLVSHLPETCYSRTDFTSPTQASAWTIPNRVDRFRIQTLKPRTFDQPAVTLAYAWHDGNQWRAPTYPRMELAGNRHLQRLMITIRHASCEAAEARSSIQMIVQSIVDDTDSDYRKLAHAFVTNQDPTE